MNTLCRECGKPAAPEYTDEHDGLCMACVHRDRIHSAFIDDEFLYGASDDNPHTQTKLEIVNCVRESFGLPVIDHDMVQPQPSDPIRDAIDRACVDLLHGKQ